MARTKNSLSAAQLLERGSDELNQLAQEKRQELLRSRFSRATGQLTKTHVLGHLRREVARIETVLRARQTAQGDVG